MAANSRPPTHPLLPLQPRAPIATVTASSSTSEPTTATTAFRRRPRQQVRAACEQCRDHKVKCNAERPVCRRCSVRNLVCVYVSDASETRLQAQRRSHETALRQMNSFEELFNLVHEAPEEIAMNIFHRIREGGSPEAVLCEVREARLLLQINNVADLCYRYELLCALRGSPARRATRDARTDHSSLGSGGPSFFSAACLERVC
jgi:hypothetical protein